VKEFLNKIKGHIIIPELWIPKPLRVNDVILMDFIDDLELSKPQKVIFNNWRLFFQITYLSEITTLEGDKIKSEYLDKRQITTTISASKLRWPHQNAPHTDTFRIWKKNVKLIANCNNEGILDIPLGEWHDDPVNLIHHKYLLHTEFTHVLIRNNTNKLWNVHETAFQIRSTIHFQKTHSRNISDYDPAKYIAINLYENNVGYYYNTRGVVKLQHSINMDIDDENFTSYIGRIMQLKDISWKNFTIIDEIQLFSSNEMIIACDSGAKDDNIGSFGISVSKGHTIVARINEKIPSIYGLLMSYRSECRRHTGNSTIYTTTT
jgi:hypothetical protein